MSEPFLILHKVRGSPAFDIAEQMEMPNGERWWIIPTSGHRAFPSAYYSVTGLKWGAYDVETLAQQSPWADLPDHYSASASRSRLATAASDILSLMGIGKAKPQTPVKRRVIPNG